MKILRKYQREMLTYATSLDHFAFFVEMRLGKTLTAIRAAKHYFKTNSEHARVLVVAPFSAWDGWKQDLTDEGLTVYPLSGSTPIKRIRVLESSDEGWFITNYESWKGIGKNLLSIKWDMVILDESDSIKSPKAKVSKFYVKNFRDVPHRAILTGTPALEGDLSYFQQLQFVDPSILGCRDFYQFRNIYCYVAGFKWSMKTTKVNQFRSILSKKCYFLKRKDVNLGSERITTKRYIQFDGKLKTIYSKIETDFILESLEDGVERAAMETFQTYIWMRQLTAGMLDGKMIWKGKINELLYLLEGDLKEESVIVWAVFTKELEEISKELNKRKISNEIIFGLTEKQERTNVIKRFNDGKTRVIVANPEVLKYGADLSKADTSIWFSLPASGKTFAQASDRTVKVGKERPVFNIMLLVENTVDELLIKALESKEGNDNKNQEIIKSLLEKRKSVAYNNK